MRISDWSSDVCSSDLIMRAAALDREMAQVLCINTKLVITAVFAFGAWLAAVGGVVAAPMRAIDPGMGDKIIIESFIVVVIGGLGSFPGALLGAIVLGRSEEHTSELQSLMRISYAVFCLKKKTQKTD